ncbi:unnamed protein product [Paramecium pentaurelia]|uniref:Uncharacterized protein n=1 Tax=Paramecium pentaurelia TaxID=43138 RepID=A0A8S1YKN7_9CILI|nr:unnamed protein product [Paramecium pentaurelia]
MINIKKLEEEDKLKTKKTVEDQNSNLSYCKKKKNQIAEVNSKESELQSVQKKVDSTYIINRKIITIRAGKSTIQLQHLINYRFNNIQKHYNFLILIGVQIAKLLIMERLLGYLVIVDVIAFINKHFKELENNIFILNAQWNMFFLMEQDLEI